MNIKTIRKIGYSTIAALLLTGTLFASPPSSGQSATVRVDASAWNFQQEASDLLTQVQTLSDKLSVDSDRLASFPHSKLSWESHATQLHLVRDHINQIGEKLARLQEIRHRGLGSGGRRYAPTGGQTDAGTNAIFAPPYRDR